MTTQAPPSTVRLVPRADLVNVLEYEAQARLAMSGPAFARVSGGDRSHVDRITLRPRLLVPARNLDLGLTLFGETLHSPIIVGPIDSRQLGVADAVSSVRRGAEAAHATAIVAGSPESLFTVGTPVAKAALWYQVFATDPSAGEAMRRAVGAGCRVMCVTVGATSSAQGIRASGVGAADWRAVQAAVKTAGAPVIVKGITSPDAARQALQQGASGIVFSNYGGLLGQRESASILQLAAVVDAVDGRVPVLMDGGFRRGTDIIKALALGASAVLVARPIVWGLAAYGADGVQGVLEMLQTELARYMAMCGKASLKELDRGMVRIHAR